jgi:hypothetical protein
LQKVLEAAKREAIVQGIPTRHEWQDRVRVNAHPLCTPRTSHHRHGGSFVRPLAWRRHGSGDDCVVFSANQGPWTQSTLQFWRSLADDAVRFAWQGITRQSITSILKNEKKSDTESDSEEVCAPIINFWFFLTFNGFGN